MSESNVCFARCRDPCAGSCTIVLSRLAVEDPLSLGDMYVLIASSCSYGLSLGKVIS